MPLLKFASLGLLIGLMPLGALAQTDSKPASQLEAGAADESAVQSTMSPRVRMSTSMGDIVLQLDGEKAPISTLNFLRYAEEGFYEGTIFHRVMPDFMIQAGGFTPDMEKKEKGMHDPIVNEWENGLKNKTGTISMARLGNQPDSATAQFFINVSDNDFLDQPRDGAGYAVFGKVIEGMDVVEKIEGAKLERNPKYPSPQPVTPVEPIVIKGVTALEPVSQQVEAAASARREAIQKAEMEAKMAKQQELQSVLDKFEAEHGKKFQTTDSGLMYMSIVEGEGASPKPTDRVEVHYWGKFLNGEQFDSSYDRKQTTTFGLNQVISGWTEGVGMMKEGGKGLFVIPSDLAYGDRGRPGIPGGSTLVFQIELVDVK